MELAHNAKSIDGIHPFFMVYGAEAVLPSDVRFSAPRVIAYTEEASNEALTQDMDALDEARDIALASTAVISKIFATIIVDGFATDHLKKET